MTSESKKRKNKRSYQHNGFEKAKEGTHHRYMNHYCAKERHFHKNQTQKRYEEDIL